MKPPRDDVTTTGEPQGEVATTVRLRRPWHKSLVSAALIATVPLAIAGVSSMQYLDAMEPQPTTAVPDNSGGYDNPVDDSVEPVAARRTVDIDPETGGVTVPTKEDRVRELSGTGDLDMPAAALKAYRNAAATIANTDPSCNIDWALMAGIGRVESDHGRYGGATVATNGKTYPHILGLPLDGSPGVAAIPDTDGGELDSDTTWDRAVGPMQFIPSTWRMVAADGDGDGVRDPHDLDDAALAAGAYLCAGNADVSTRAGAEAAVFSYNHSDEYVALVLAIADAYRSGEVYLPSVPSGPGIGTAPSLSEVPGNGGARTQGAKSGAVKRSTKAKAAGTRTTRQPADRRASRDAEESKPQDTRGTQTNSTAGAAPKRQRQPESNASAPEQPKTKTPKPPEKPKETEPPPFTPEPISLAGELTKCAGGLWCLPDLKGSTPTPMDLSAIGAGIYDKSASDLETELAEMAGAGVGASASGTTQESGVVIVTDLVPDREKELQAAAPASNGSAQKENTRVEETPAAEETPNADNAG